MAEETWRGARGYSVGARLLRDPAEDRKAVDAPQLRLAAQARVEDLRREGGRDAEDQARHDPPDDAQRRLGGRRVWWAAVSLGLDPHRRVAARPQGLELGDLVGEWDLARDGPSPCSQLCLQLGNC